MKEARELVKEIAEQIYCSEVILDDCSHVIPRRSIGVCQKLARELIPIIEKHMAKRAARLVEALERIEKLNSAYSAINGSAFTARKIARTALAEHSTPQEGGVRQ